MNSDPRDPAEHCSFNEETHSRKSRSPGARFIVKAIVDMGGERSFQGPSFYNGLKSCFEKMAASQPCSSAEGGGRQREPK